MDGATLIGFLAGSLTTIAFLPQLIKTWRTKCAEDLSVWLLLTFNFGVLLWLIYGLLIRSMPVILANFVTFVLAMAILLLKLRYRK
jgi:MtN3 and saliva related transmembrane protein